MEAWLAAGVVVWLVCVVLAWGLTFAYFQKEFPELAYKKRRYDIASATLIAALGPMALLFGLIIFEGYKYGLCFKLMSEEESWKAFQKRFPSAPRDLFDRL